VKRIPLIRIGWVLLATVFFLTPLLATVKFSFTFGRLGLSTRAYSNLFDDVELRGPLWISIQLAVLTVIASLALMLPTMVWLHLKVPKLRPLVEVISILPFVIPPVVLVMGVSQVTRGWPEWLIGKPWFLVPIYVVLTFPFMFRALDAGIRSIDLLTLTEASRSLGASWTTTLRSVIIPSLRTSILGVVFLVIAVVMGEFTVSSLLLFKTLPIYLTAKGQTEVQGAAALSIMSLLFLWLVLLILAAVSRKRGGGRRLAVSVAPT
jgi:putative spermidine/putrescine transport system permease protein